MRTLSKRQVGQTPALLWATAEAAALDNEAAFVLHKGKPAYRVEYIGNDVDPLAELERRGLYTPPSTSPPPIPTFTGARYTTEQIDAIVEEMRGEY